jgi:acetyl-CoA synthetase
VHGDFASRDTDGMWYVRGRSDDTLKIAGKRTGPAEVEALLMATGLLQDAVTIGARSAPRGLCPRCDRPCPALKDGRKTARRGV